MAKLPRNSQVFTPANVVTTVRIALIPVFVFAILAPWPDWILDSVVSEAFAGIKPLVAAVVFALLALSDSVDGYLARSRNEVTTLGKFLDPLADKILVTAALLALTELGTLPAWIALVIIAREFLVSGLRMVASAEGLVIAASSFGKAKTVLQIIAVLFFLLKDMPALQLLGDTIFSALQYFSWAVMIAAIVLTLFSLADYFFKSAAALGLPLRVAAETSGMPLASPEDVIAAARAAGCTIGTAESCTGGLVAAALTEVPGASEVYKGGIVSYSNEIKQQRLMVAAETLARYGAVSEQTACEMALGALQALEVDIAVSVTGIAGPDGATPEKPVGMVWFGIACSHARILGSPDAEKITSPSSLDSPSSTDVGNTLNSPRTLATTYAEHCQFSGDRAAIRAQAVAHALSLLKSYCST